jgi:structural maintenance of chromosomes protein 6
VAIKNLFTFSDDVYGKEITIVRTINGNSGASSYKLKNEAGRVISTSRQDLNKLTLCLNIQVENPVLILNQDAARSFLKECDPKKLYTLFLKATQIEAIIDKLHSCLKCASSSKSQLEHLDRSIKALEGEIVVIKEKHEKLQSVARLRDNIIGYKNELEWLKVAKVEKELQEAQTQLAKKREQLAKINDLVKNKNKIDKELKEKIRDYGTEFAALSTVVGEKDEVTETCRNDYDAKQNELSSAENIYRGNAEKIKLQQQNLQQLEADIAERAENPQNVDNMRKENEAKIQALEKKKEDVALMLENARRDQNQFQETFGDFRDKVENASKHKAREQAEVQKCTGQIRNLQGSSKDSLSVYGPSMSQLIKRIEDMHKKGQFKQLPRGPLGRYIEVPDRRFKSAVENILETSLTSFFVSCDHDRMQLTKVLQGFQEFARLQIITGQFHDQVYDVRNGVVQLDQGMPGRVLLDVIQVRKCIAFQKH